MFCLACCATNSELKLVLISHIVSAYLLAALLESLKLEMIDKASVFGMSKEEERVVFRCVFLLLAVEQTPALRAPCLLLVSCGTGPCACESATLPSSTAAGVGFA